MSGGEWMEQARDQTRDLQRAIARITDLEADRAALEKERDAINEARERDLSAMRALLSRYTTLSVGSLVQQTERLLQVMELRCDRVATERDATIQKLRARIADLTGETVFLAQRVAWHLAHGCDTAAKARELAMAEWGAGVMGGGA